MNGQVLEGGADGRGGRAPQDGAGRAKQGAGILAGGVSAPQNPHVQVPTPRASECDLICKQGCRRHN